MREDAWDAREASATRDEWDYRLDARERREIRDAGRRLVDSGASMEEIASSAAASALSPALSQRFEAMRRDLLTGRGFALIRGVPVEDAGPEERAAMALCLGSQFGKLLPQNGKGHVLGHVKDIGLDASNPNHRIYATRAAQPFHTDSADLVGLLCLRKAKRGGLSSFCSSTRIFHDISRERPDLAGVLLRPFFVDRKGEIPAGKLPFYELPIFHRTRQGRVVGIMDRSFIQAAQRWPEVPRLTPEQTEALDLVEAKAESEDLCFRMMLEPGDLQLIHNHVIFHARSEFEDHAEDSLKRHLLRLWMCPEDGIELPEEFAERYGTVTRGDRGGMPCAEIVAPLDAC